MTVASEDTRERVAAPISNDELRLLVVAATRLREVYVYATEAAKRLLDAEGKHLVIDANGAGLDFRLLDMKDDLGVSDD